MRIIELTPPTQQPEQVEQQVPTGRIIELTPPTAVAESPPEAIEEEGEDILGSLGRIAGQVGEQLVGTAQVIGTIGSGAVAESVAGITGLAKTITTNAEEGEQVAKDFRKAITLQPATEAGRKQLEAVGQVFTTPIPIIEDLVEMLGGDPKQASIAGGVQAASQAAGDTIFELTGSPALASLAYTAPTAAIEILGAKGASRFTKAGQAKKVGKPVKPFKPKPKEVRKIIQQHAPEPGALLDAAKGVFDEVDALGATIKPGRLGSLVDDVNIEMKKGGFRRRINKDVAELVDEINDLKAGQPMKLGDLDELREVARGIAKSTDPQTKALGVKIIDSIDDFLVSDDLVDLPTGIDSVNVGQRLKEARNFYGRGKKGLEIAEIFEEAGRADLGKFTDTIRNEFKKIKRSKKKWKFYNKEDRAYMNEVISGGKVQKILEFAGKGGLQSNPIFKLGMEGSASLLFGSPTLAAAIPVIGTVSKALADRLRKGNAVFADAVIRSGKNPVGVVDAYLKHTLKGARSSDELSQLLFRPNIDLSLVKDPSPFVQSAIQKAQAARNRMNAALAGGAAAAQAEQAELPK